MANRKFSVKENMQGIFFVDATCIACDTCVGIAPDCFSLTPDCDHAYVSGQPKSELETTKCLEALRTCPVQAIGTEYDT